jgi:carboxypeptidase C (cathepsin A)
MPIFLAILATLFSVPAAAQQQHASGQSASQDAASAGIFTLMPADSVTEHVLATPSGEIAYTVTAGTIDLFGQDGKQTAKLFYTAYVAKDRGPDRPLTFAFNGGPGAASAYLHLGLVGPKVLEFGPQGDDGTTPTLKDNPDSWLRFTDLVLIDPVGTGWSRAASNDTAESFYGVSQDTDSLAKMIALYVQKNNRITSPKFLLGESYGGFRAAKVAAALKDNQGLLVSGMIMLSPLIEGRFLFGAGDDPLSAALQLPSLAAAELERNGRFTTEALAEAERFAMNDYLVALAGPPLSGEEARSFYRRVATITGIDEDAVARVRGFVGDIYAKHTNPEDRIVSPYDAAYARPDAYPEAAYARNDDPILDGYTRAYGGAFANYASHELGYQSVMTYTMLNQDVNRRWAWGGGHGGGSRQSASAANDIRDLLSVIPTFRLMVAHGYSDAITPYGMSRYVLDHLPPALAEGRASLELYRGGHMFYTDPVSRRMFFDDVANFYGNATSD